MPAQQLGGLGWRPCPGRASLVGKGTKRIYEPVGALSQVFRPTESGGLQCRPEGAGGRAAPWEGAFVALLSEGALYLASSLLIGPLAPSLLLRLIYAGMKADLHCLGSNPGALHLLGKHSTPGPHPSPGTAAFTLDPWISRAGRVS